MPFHPVFFMTSTQASVAHKCMKKTSRNISPIFHFNKPLMCLLHLVTMMCCITLLYFVKQKLKVILFFSLSTLILEWQSDGVLISIFASEQEVSRFDSTCWPQPLQVVLACSLHAYVGLIWVLWIPPTVQRHALVRLTDNSKLSVAISELAL